MKRNRKHNRFRICLAAAALIVAVAAVGVFLVLRCLSFDADGAHVIDRYGVLAREQGSGEAPARRPGMRQTEPEQAPAMRAVWLAADDVADEETRGTLLGLARAGALDTVVVAIKDSEGKRNLAVDTGAPDDADSPTGGGADALADAIAALRAAGVHVVGRISCFHDQRATRQNADLAMRYKRGGTWLDYDNTRWLDPTNPSAVDYLGDIARAAVRAGCDELVLADFTFPPRGHLDRVAFDRNVDDQASVLLEALRDIRDAAGGAPVSLTADSLDALTALSENGEGDGVPVGDVGALLGAAHRLFVPADDADTADALAEGARGLASDAAVVPVFDDVDTWDTYRGDAVLDAAADSGVLHEIAGE